ncbi:hypothetical protein H8E52_03500, partial [bacterium]|nr:hypothetical protein [bacterium]
ECEAVLRNTSLPGRFHVVQDEPLMVIDGGHNPQALEAVLGEWDRRVPDGGTIVFGCSADKEVDALLDLLKAKPRRMIITRAQNPRSINPDELYDRAGTPESWTVAPDSAAAMIAAQKGPLLVTGSFYLAGEAYLILKIGW